MNQTFLSAIYFGPFCCFDSFFHRARRVVSDRRTPSWQQDVNNLMERFSSEHPAANAIGETERREVILAAKRPDFPA
jgi:hypothetical protein